MNNISFKLKGKKADDSIEGFRCKCVHCFITIRLHTLETLARFLTGEALKMAEEHSALGTDWINLTHEAGHFLMGFPDNL